MQRRTLLKTLTATAFGFNAAGAVDDPVARYLETLRKQDGAYGWADDDHSHLTPSFFAIECYRILKMQPPSPKPLGDWIRGNHPLPARRLEDRPLRRFWFEQIRSLQRLGMDVSHFLPTVKAWDGPSVFTTRYELGGNPVFQHEAHALLCRELLGLSGTPQWTEYVHARRRANGAYNTTPAKDGSDGHVMNTWWGLQAEAVLKQTPASTEVLIAWIESCQRPNGGFTYAPNATVGAVDDIAYTWAALKCLQTLQQKPKNAAAAVRYIHSLADFDEGLSFRDREDREPSPMATFYALDALNALQAAMPAQANRRLRPSARTQPKLRICTMQIQAPGAGSPSDAVELARALDIHLWAAKNSAPGWIERAQQIAARRGVPVEFCVGDEEYGTFFGLPGLGTYSHLADIVAPAGRDIGQPMTPKEAFLSWERFRDERLRKLRAANGHLVWQFNENEELTRILLDDAVKTGAYAAISSFHFGNENFLNTQPFLMRYKGVIPFVALQDAHAAESWWWGNELEGLRTVFLAEEPSWKSWLEALRLNRVMAIRQDAVTAYQPRFAGGDPAMRAMVIPWWKQRQPALARPPAVLAVVRPGDAFEAFAPTEGLRVRLRLLQSNTTQGLPLAPQAELVRLRLNDNEVAMQYKELRNAQGRLTDCFHYADFKSDSTGNVVAEVRSLKTGKVVRLSAQLQG